MKKTYIVRLTNDERSTCLTAVKKLKGTSRKVLRAHILLQADADDPNWNDQNIANAFLCSRQCVENLRKRLVTEGFAIALNGKKRKVPASLKRLDGKQETEVLALCLSAPPEGRNGWTLRLLAHAKKVILVCDHLNTHTRGAFDEALARSLVRRLEIVQTPKYGSWLNVSENDLSALTVQWVRHRRFGTIEERRKTIGVWTEVCNAKQKKIQWQFNVEKARAKLKKLYPSIE